MVEKGASAARTPTARPSTVDYNQGSGSASSVEEIPLHDAMLKKTSVLFYPEFAKPAGVRVRPLTKCSTVQELFEQAYSAGFFQIEEPVRAVGCYVEGKEGMYRVAFGDEEDFAALLEAIRTSSKWVTGATTCTVEVNEL